MTSGQEMDQTYSNKKAQSNWIYIVRSICTTVFTNNKLLSY